MHGLFVQCSLQLFITTKGEDMKYNESYPPSKQQFREGKIKKVSKEKFYEVHLYFKR